MSRQEPDMNKILFTNLIMMLSSSAMQQLGKLVNPMTHKTEVNLEGAQMSIDMLEMLRVKTLKNLDEEEERMLREILSTVQINYVETSRNPPAKEEPKADQKPSDKAGAGEQDSKTKA